MLLDFFKVILIALGLITVATLGTIVVSGIINEIKIKKEIKQINRFKKAFYAEIVKRNKNAVDVGIFDEEDDKLGEIEIKSDKGVDSSLKKHQIIYIYD